ncbi:hypothetical protein LINPERHAP2_LOCUS22689 [Linum perenne]
MGEPYDPVHFIGPGPEEDNVLHDQANHRSEHIWKNQGQQRLLHCRRAITLPPYNELYTLHLRIVGLYGVHELVRMSHINLLLPFSTCNPDEEASDSPPIDQDPILRRSRAVLPPALRLLPGHPTSPFETEDYGCSRRRFSFLKNQCSDSCSFRVFPLPLFDSVTAAL